MTTLEERVQLMESTPWVDPVLASTMSTNKTDVAPRGTPPNRLTIYVPWSQNLWTIVNLGAEHIERDFGNGIFMRTKEHIQWRTRDSLVAMGGKPKHVQRGTKGSDTDHHGFTQWTADDAYHHADLQHCLKSKTDNMVFRTMGAGRWAVLQSDTGITEVNSGSTVIVNAKKHLFVTSDGGYEKATQTYKEHADPPFPPQARDASFKFFKAKVIAKALLILKAAVGVAAAAKKQVDEAKEKKLGWKSVFSVASAKALLNITKIGAAIQGLVPKEESIKVSSDAGVSIWGNANANFYGNVCAGVGTLGLCTIGGTTADVKGYATAGVWGKFKAVLSANSGSASVVSHLHKVAVDAPLCSFVANGNIIATAQTQDATVRGDDVCAIYGGKRAYVGADGYGMVAKDDRIDICELTNPKDFAGAGPQENNRITIRSASVLAMWKQARLGIKKDEAYLRYGKRGLTLSSSGCVIKAKKIEVDT